MACYKMAGIAMMLGGAMANALAFTGSSYLFSSMSKDRIDKEKGKGMIKLSNNYKRHKSNGNRKDKKE